MKKDNRGQISLEYLLIFSISLLVLIVFTLPLTETTIENTLDISDTLNVKSDLSKMAHAIKKVYGEGHGSRQVIHINSKYSIKVDIDYRHISSNLKLKDNSNKKISVGCNSNLDKSTIYLNKGENVIIVEWPVNAEKMKFYKS